MKRSVIFAVAAVLVGVSSLAACSQPDSPVQAIESYLQYRSASDEARLLTLSCKDWEGQARTEAASFQSMNARLDGMACSQAGTDGQFTVVACTGKIITTYAGETRSRDLADKNFKTIQEDGRWKMCGYANVNSPGQ
jgi:hypothetical protein